MTFDIDAKPESPRLPLFGKVGAILLAAATRAGVSVRMPASKLRLRGRGTCFWMRFTPSLT